MKIQVDNLEDLEKAGVYCITNIINKKIYIGSTKNKLKRRFIEHKCGLNTNKHFNPYLQRSYNKYGIEAFEFKILEVTSKDSCKEREQYYLDLYKAYDNKIGYNIEINVLKLEVSKETKNKISNTLKNKYKNGELVIKSTFKKGVSSWNKGLKCPQIGDSRRKLFNSIEVYTLSKELIVTFRSITDLEEWSIINKMPHIVITSNNRKGFILRKDKIYHSIKTNIPYKGLLFKLIRPLSPEMEIANWMNSKNAEMPTLSQAKDTSLEGATTT